MRCPVITLSRLVLALGLCHSVGAQAPQLAPGDRIRLTAPTVSAVPVVGIVGSMGPDTILVRTGADVGLAFPLDKITRLEVSRGVRLPTWSKTAPLWMALAGAAIGGIGGAAKPASRTSPRESGEFIALVGGSIGFLGGTVTMFAVGAREKWATVPRGRSASRTTRPPSPYIAPAPRGLTVGLRAAF